MKLKRGGISQNRYSIIRSGLIGPDEGGVLSVVDWLLADLDGEVTVDQFNVDHGMLNS